MRGENHKATHLRLRGMGSSPHARGKLCSLPVLSGLLGLIPACAGKTKTDQAVYRSIWAHPRMRGENDVARAIGEHPEGSSPHARGKLASSINYGVRRRLIPACAGKTKDS